MKITRLKLVGIGLIVFFLVVGNGFATSVLYRPGASIPTMKSYEVDLTFSYFSKSASYDLDGAKVEMSEGDSFSMMNFDGLLHYSYGKQLGFRGGLRWRQVDSQDGIYTNSNSGLESFSLGVKYVFKPVNKWRFAVDLEYRRTAYDNTIYDSNSSAPQDDIVLGDGGDWATFGGYATMVVSPNHFLEIFAGYSITPSHLSPEIPYRLSSVWPFVNWAFSLGLKGIYSMGSDEYETDPAAKPPLSTGETAMFNSH